MIQPSKKTVAVVYSIAAVLALLYILSLTVFSSNKSSKRHIQQIQLLHEADISNIDIITIQNGINAIILTRTDNMWLVANQNDFNDRIPADTQRLQKFFVLLASKHNLTKVGKSDTSQGNSYGLDASEGTIITLYKNGAAYQSLTFGALNFSQTERYFTTQELNSVFLAGQEFDGFLNVSVKTWADPYIISEQLRNDVFTMGQVQTAQFYDYNNGTSCILDSSIAEHNESISKLLELRHGGFVEKTEQPLSKTITVILQMGDKSQITLDLYEHPEAENEYIVQTTFTSERTGTGFTYTTQISNWTYSKISAMML